MYFSNINTLSHFTNTNKEIYKKQQPATEIVMNSNSNPSVSLPNNNTSVILKVVQSPMNEISDDNSKPSLTLKKRQSNHKNTGEQHKINQDNIQQNSNNIPDNNDFENEYN